MQQQRPATVPLQWFLAAALATLVAACGGGGGGDGSGSAPPDTSAPALTVSADALVTNQADQPLSGTVEAGATLQVAVVPSGTAANVAVSGTTWSCTATGLVEGMSTITVTASDAAGNITTVQVTVTSDRTLPSATALRPLSDAADAPVRGQICATFSEPLDPATLDAASFTVAKPLAAPLPGAVGYDPLARRACFSPAAAFTPGTLYQATLAATVADPAGNRLAAPHAWHFTTSAPATAFDEADFWMNAGGTYEPVNVLVRQAGGGSIRLDTGAAGLDHQIYSPTGAFAFLLPEDAALKLWLYVPEPADDHQLYLFLGQGGFAGYARALLPSLAVDGWRCLTLTRADFTLVGPFSWAAPVDTLSLLLAGAVTTRPNVQLFLDAVYVTGKDLPTISFTFDDGYASDFSEAFAWMNLQQMPGTSFVNGASIGWDGYLDAAAMATMYAAGWDFANHTGNHGDLSTLAPAERLAAIAAGRDWLVASGYPRAADYLAFPYGAFAGTSAELVAAGVVAARTVQPVPLETGSGRSDPLRYPATLELGPATTLAEAVAAVDRAIRFGQSLIVYAHEIVPGAAGTYKWTRADFRALVDYVAAQRDAGALQVRTFRELHLLLNP